jgi:NAD(P)-dependent dehydrogenase (short-subunit alcohol dehydrogenase family)
MNIIITGASRGIGFETVKILSRDATNNILAIARNPAGLQNLQKECLEISGKSHVHVFPFDLVNDNYTEMLLPEVTRWMNRVDVLVNNAGLMIHKPFELMEDADYQLIFDANVRSVFRLTQALLPYFSENAHIVNIGSMGGYQGSVKFPGLSLYSASKGALAILTECLAEEFTERGIKVNCLALGSAQTEMLEAAFPGYKAPLTASEMASFVADFAIRGHHWFNGKVLPVAVSTP